ncbi:MAG: alternate-type signal peptide domain-containing protein [Aeromicrobium sp.]|uniref:alternate-type signal peptide domain-containing protein n=1 Tax=Aeromicrobium sp. TaxID=1871063 RepID=UPI0039E5E6F4
MNKSTKGALAAAAAAVLLLGGAGTLAYWTADGSITGAEITSGHLTLDASACEGTSGWSLEGDTFDTSTDTLIPGDTLTKSCNIVVDVEGTHFTQVDIEATTPTGTLAAPWDELTVGATVNGSATGGDDIAVNQGTNNIPVVITVTWPYGSAADNDLNGDLSTTLSSITVTAVQDHQDDAN